MIFQARGRRVPESYKNGANFMLCVRIVTRIEGRYIGEDYKRIYFKRNRG